MKDKQKQKKYKVKYRYKYSLYAKTPHALIAGATSSGKTFMLYYLMMQFAKRGAEIYILDPKRSDLSSLIHYIPEGHNHVAFTPNQICSILRKLNDEMNLRYEKYFSNTAKMGVNYQYFKLKPIVIFFDELGAFVEEDKKVSKEADSYLKQLVMKGRQAGIFLVLSTQKPNAEAISTSVRDQIGLRIALGQLSKPGYKMTLGDDWESLPSVEIGTGKGLIMIDGLNWSTPRAYTAPFLDLEKLRFQSTLYHLLEKGNENLSMIK
ncbi:cell division protein FtsK [Bacillus badius]|uniref:FtsK/SpoIIIE domain-containing protein n=1 Tax=Bacillus badius TaxID=1455 RepID=UPI001CBC32B0|nr:FtsK/SpoIIIE domain-containing protein [Bacillus badius]UAT31313.1 cell division protein FtsK [Bacillus badius]